MKLYSFIPSMLVIAFGIMFIPREIMAQEGVKLYFNTGYVTNFKADPDRLKADAGGSIRIGLLNEKEFGHGRMGYYAGYLFFQEYPFEDAEYVNSGSVLMAGIDFLIFKKGNSRWYAKLGLATEKYMSKSRNRTDAERSFKPDFGVLYTYKKFNVYAGWQPSAPHQLNIGLGYVLD